MHKSRLSLYIAVILMVIASVLLAVLLPPVLSGLTGRSMPATTFGLFLFGSFSYASLYIPVYFIISAALVIRKSFKVRYSVLLLLSILPFLTLGLFFKVVFTAESSLAAAGIISLFGEKESALLLFLLFLVEILSIYVISLKLSGLNISAVPEEEKPVLQLPQPEKSGNDAEEETGAESSFSFFVELPDVPEFKSESVFDEEDTFEESDEIESFYGDEESEESESFEISKKPEIQTDTENNKEGLYKDPESISDVLPRNPPFRLELQKMPVPDKEEIKYEIPADKILNDYSNSHYWIIDDETRKAADVLKETLEEFKIKAEVTGIKKGPVITMFEILPAPGVKLSKIVNLADNIALRLAASRIRIVAPIPGKHAVGIEVPNRNRAIVSFKEMLADDIFRKAGVEIPIVLGKDITGESQIVDLVQTPHLLIAGATGSGKSVCVNSIICSILYKRKPEEVRIILIDPKIVELKLYNDIPHLLTPVITEPKRAFQALQYCIYEMERRYSLLDSLGVRDIRAYNKKIRKGKYAARTLPYIVVIVDEFADLIATAGKELESTLARLAAMARAVGIHLVLATQRPSIDVITGLIKANIPSRIAFMVANKIDSRIILDTVGADKLLGKGDMLFASAWDPALVRIQGAFVSDEEVERLTDYVKTLGEPDYIDEEIFFDSDENEDVVDDYSVNDPLMDKSIEIVTVAGKASASYLQRRLKIGYNRAARIVEEMEKRGIVGPQNGSKPREILHIPEKYRENK